MGRIIRSGWLLGAIFAAVLMGVLVQRNGEGKVEVSGESSKELVVTIGSPDRSLLSVGDPLRKASKFREAIEEYRDVVTMEGVEAKLKAEAQYNIGLSYMWLGDYGQAEAAFGVLKQTYPTDGTATGWAEYGLAHIDISRGEYRSALSRCQAILEKKAAADPKLYAFAQYQIGRINLVFLHHPARAKEAFLKTIQRYPASEPARLAHLFLEDIRLLSP